MVHVELVDPSRSIKRILWESSVNSVVAGSTYLFHNLTVHKDKFTDEVYLSKTEPGTGKNITENFQEMLVVASQAPAEKLLSSLTYPTICDLSCIQQ